MRIVLGGVTDSALIHEAIPGDAVVLHAHDGAELEQLTRALVPDLLLVEGGLAGVWAALQLIGELYPIPVLMLAQPADAIPIPWRDHALYGYLVQPINAPTLRAMIPLCVEQHRRWQAAQEEIARLRATIAERKIIERAKGLLMQHHQISERDAYTLMRNASRRRRVSLAELAGMLLQDDANALHALRTVPMR